MRVSLPPQPPKIGQEGRESMAEKEIIDIEALLVRAYRQYAMDRVTPERAMGASAFRRRPRLSERF